MNLPHGLEGWNTPLAFWGVLAASFIAGMLLTAAIIQRPQAPNRKGKGR
jgi:hypothetical protein